MRGGGVPISTLLPISVSVLVTAPASRPVTD